MTNTDPQANTSFLDETQLEGKGKGKIEIGNLDQAIASVHIIMNEEALRIFKETPEDQLPTSKIAVLCHECRELVPPGVGKTKFGTPRTICGICKSKKVSLGREESLRKFYHLEKKG